MASANKKSAATDREQLEEMVSLIRDQIKEEDKLLEKLRDLLKKTGSNEIKKPTANAILRIETRRTTLVQLLKAMQTSSKGGRRRSTKKANRTKKNKRRT